MAKKTWLTAKLCRGLSWNCVDSRLRTIDAFSSHDLPLRVRNCTRDLGIRAQARVREYVRGFGKCQREREQEKVIYREAEMMRGSEFSLSLFSFFLSRFLSCECERCERNRSVRYAAICIHIGSL